MQGFNMIDQPQLGSSSDGCCSIEELEFFNHFLG